LVKGKKKYSRLRFAGGGYIFSAGSADWLQYVKSWSARSVSVLDVVRLSGKEVMT
jgi:hypothetical protein